MPDDANRSTPPAPSGPPTSIALATGQTMDLSIIPEAQRTALLAEYAKGTLNIAQKANDLHVDVEHLRSTLQTLSVTAEKVSQDGNSVTITHVHNGQVARTEIIMGNTETAGKGRLTKSQTGETNWTPYYIFAAIAAVVLIAIAIASHEH